MFDHQIQNFNGIQGVRELCGKSIVLSRLALVQCSSTIEQFLTSINSFFSLLDRICWTSLHVFFNILVNSSLLAWKKDVLVLVNLGKLTELLPTLSTNEMKLENSSKMLHFAAAISYYRFSFSFSRVVLVLSRFVRVQLKNSQWIGFCDADLKFIENWSRTSWTSRSSDRSVKQKKFHLSILVNDQRHTCKNDSKFKVPIT
jgi:hypothetical protein